MKYTMPVEERQRRERANVASLLRGAEEDLAVIEAFLIALDYESKPANCECPECGSPTGGWAKEALVERGLSEYDVTEALERARTRVYHRFPNPVKVD